MPLAHIEFQPKDGTPESREELEVKLSWYGACLWKDGRISDGYSTCSTEDAVRLSVYFFGQAAVSGGVSCSYTKLALAEVHKLARSRAKWVVTKSSSALDNTASWRGAKSIVLASPSCLEVSPCCRHGRDFRIIPHFTFPIDDTARERLTHWLALGRDLHSIWLYSGVLEAETNQVLTDCRGEHLSAGREFAAGIEESTGTPTYLELFRYCSLGDAELARRCPGCGGKWLRPGRGFGLASYPFRCERCRMVSEAGIKDETGKLAKVGEWRAGRKPIESAASIRNRIRRGTLIL